MTKAPHLKIVRPQVIEHEKPRPVRAWLYKRWLTLRFGVEISGWVSIITAIIVVLRG